jgi:hypothetical protein
MGIRTNVGEIDFGSVTSESYITIRDAATNHRGETTIGEVLAAGAYTSTDAITAHSGGGKASATPLTKQFHRVTTAAATAAPFDSVLLPAAVVGMFVILVNSAANPIQVFGAGTNTINDVATGTGITVQARSVDMFVCPVTGKWYTEASVGSFGPFPTVSTTNAITALGVDQATAVPLTTVMNRVTGGDASAGVLLPVSAAGMQIFVYNAAAETINVYAQPTETINGASSATGFALATGKNASFAAPVAGSWHAILSA